MDDVQLRQEFLHCPGHALVIGGPGSGKTTIALQKAIERINKGLLPGQSVLFVSFSRSAVARIIEASKLKVKKNLRERLDIQTFHSFFWSLLAPHSYLLGAKKPLSILLPQDEGVFAGKIKKKFRNMENPEWVEWLHERERLFREDGRIAFDLFAPNALALATRSAHLGRIIAQRHPLIIIDEAQDTNEQAWQFIALLSQLTQVVCLADLEQQIFDHLEGIGPERIDAIKVTLNPLLLDLGAQNHRSPNTEIAIFGQDILLANVRGAPYKGVSRFPYNPKPPHDFTRTLRMALGSLHRKIRKETGQWGRSVAILVSSGASAGKVSAALSAAAKPVKHKLLFDENEALLSARFAAFLLEPKRLENRVADLATAVELVSDIKRSGGLVAANQMLVWANAIKAGKIPTAGFVKKLAAAIDDLRETRFSGDPAKDWQFVKLTLRASGQPELLSVVKSLDYVVGFNRGKRIFSGLSEIWKRDGQYTRARDALDLALAQDQILAGLDDPSGLQVMTIHKSKGKQFDGVIVLRESVNTGRAWTSSFVWRDDAVPYWRSRKILRVAVTRAKTHTLILDPRYPNCPIIGAHKL